MFRREMMASPTGSTAAVVTWQTRIQVKSFGARNTSPDRAQDGVHRAHFKRHVQGGGVRVEVLEAFKHPLFVVYPYYYVPFAVLERDVMVPASAVQRDHVHHRRHHPPFAPSLPSFSRHLSENVNGLTKNHA